MRGYLLFIFTALACRLPAQVPSLSIGATAHYGKVFIHSPEIQKIKNANPVGTSVDLIWQRIDSNTWNSCHCFPRMGLSIVYFDFDSKILGNSTSLTYFLEPSFRITKGWQVALRGSLGLSYLSNPYSALSNPDNLSYSLPVAGYLGVGTGFNLKVSERLNFSMFANYFHVSNGGIKDPNKGIDWPTISLGVDYSLRKTKLPVWPKTKMQALVKKWRKDVYLLASGRNAQVGDKILYPVYGLGTTISRQVGRLNAFSAGAEWHVDLAEEELLSRELRAGLNGKFGGLLAGHEFLLGDFIFSQQLGVYFYKNNPDYPWLYHRYGLVYRINRHWGAGINFKAFSKYAHFLDARLVWSF